MRKTYSGLVKGILTIIFSGLLTTIVACAPAQVSTPPAAQPSPAVSTPATSTPATPAYTINISNKAGIGDFLVDSKRMTIYYFTRDTNAKSSATAAIVKNWPIFYAASIVVPTELNASDFGTITRDDGAMQTTFRGWPLYYFAKDQAAGDTMGQGGNSVWFVVTPNADFLPAPATPLTPNPQPTPSAPATTPAPYSY